MTTVSPFYHYNSGDYNSNPDRRSRRHTENRSSTYAGGQASFAANYRKNDLQVGFLSFYQSDNQFFGAIFNDGSGIPRRCRHREPTANLEAFYIDDKFNAVSVADPFCRHAPHAILPKATLPSSSMAPPIAESAIQPRFGATLTIPRLRWTFRAFYGHYYQAPPLETVSGPLISSVTQQQGLRLPAAARRARRRTSVRRQPSLSADGCSMPITSKPTSPEFSRPQQYRIDPTSFSPSPFPKP